MTAHDDVLPREGCLTRFVETHYDELVARCRTRVAARPVPVPTEFELEHGIPVFLKQLSDRLGKKTSEREAISRTASKHGGEMQIHGFTVAQVVHDYGDACQSITQLAIERGVEISTENFRALNECLDNAIADALTEFSRRRDIAESTQSAGVTNERLGCFAHELRDFLNAAMLAFDALRSGGVGIGGSTGAVLSRSLTGMRDLITSTLSDVRLTTGIETREPIRLRDFMEEVEVAALMDAKARGLRLTITALADGIVVEGDRQIFGSIVSNLLQNALKFTRPGGDVKVRTITTATRVVIEVEDECGGLPAGMPERMFRPFGEQTNPDKSGLGLGLAICRRGAESLGATLGVRDLPGQGCVFTLDLARYLAP